MRIKDMPKESQPRYRFKKLGEKALSDSELLAIILSKGTKNENAIEIANRLLSNFGKENLSNLSLIELQKINGIGPAKAMQIKALFEFIKRTKKKEKKYINSAQDVFNMYYEEVKDEKQERFIIVMLDTKNKIISDKIISIGILDQAILHPREVFKPAIKNSSSRIILVHNHPSGDPNPSQEDIILTEKIKKAGDLLCIKVLDHVIVGESYWSWRENRL
ncbi:DNA repair protein RadC [Candidatus Woesearchaeota archaeon]|nr:DNA repair protein RadC [Candidatus Woesearchaeota archaeon]